MISSYNMPTDYPECFLQWRNNVAAYHDQYVPEFLFAFEFSEYCCDRGLTCCISWGRLCSVYAIEDKHPFSWKVSICNTCVTLKIYGENAQAWLTSLTEAHELRDRMWNKIADKIEKGYDKHVRNIQNIREI